MTVVADGVLRAAMEMTATTAAQQIMASEQEYRPRGLYLGNGIVMCYVQPLGCSMWLESQDKGMTPHLCSNRG